MRLFEASFETVLYRYILMLGIVIVSFAINLPFLAVLSLPVVFTALTSITFKLETKRKTAMKVNRWKKDLNAAA